MKNSEKLFLYINEIDEELIEDADSDEEKPIQMKPEPRSPAKGLIAFAACVAALAVGIFAIVKFRTNGNFDPVSAPSEYVSDTSDSSDNSDQSSYPDINFEFTAEDPEFRAELKELVNAAEDIDRMFKGMGHTPGKKFRYYFEGDEEHYYEDEYFEIPEDRRTDMGLFAVPQTYDEMEALVTRYFSERAALFYMEYVSKGSMTENDDGTYNVEIFKGSSYPKFIEIDGRMYRTNEIRGGGLGIDCGTARIIRKTEKSIDFLFWGHNYNDMDNDGAAYAERNGSVTIEDGVMKLQYFFDHGFIPEIPAEYTDRDLELQEILAGLAKGDRFTSVFTQTAAAPFVGDDLLFIFGGRAFPYIETVYPQPGHTFPRTCEELEETLLQYFAQEAVERYMERVCKGTMTANPDGTYSVTLDKDIGYPSFVEIDGKMYYWNVKTAGPRIYYNNTAQVIEQTDGTITYSCAILNYYAFVKDTQRICYERGGWKLDPFFYESPDYPG